MKFIGLGLVYLLCAVAWAVEALPLEDVDAQLDVVYPDLFNSSDVLPISFSVVDDPFVLLITRKLNWFEATAACAQRGFTLASIASLAKQQSLYRVIASSGVQNQMNEPVWTSGSNLANGAVWSWYSTGSPFTYRNFREQNVNTQYRCMAYNAINGYWTAELCTAKRYFICECA
ncbi:hypothetical protein KR093_010003 [Drosophila rubida]|uniref:C-type lectin domain-containing protein n=1 Tax=Drosophila rubida TaxID=30044 RepID=A0AAD4PG48_9MUSC|nr:hypothetical protein KR093_010003 [Drosophila rubida]